jgi:hypothetical protein
VFEKLDFLVRFWELKARHATLGQPLTSKEQIELLSLMQLVTHDLELPEPGPVARPDAPLAAELIGEGVILAVEVRAVSAAGLLLSTSARVPEGNQLCVRIADAVAGVEYTLPCKVRWTHGRARAQGGSSSDSPVTLALIVDGVPSRIRFGMAQDPARGSQLSMPLGRTERLLG